MSDDPASMDAFRWESLTRQIKALQITWDSMGDKANSERLLAALNMQWLMNDVEALKRAIRNNDRDIADLIQQRLELISNADKLRAERDEARREVCKLKAWNAQERLGPEGYALLRKWDCFARDTSEHL